MCGRFTQLLTWQQVHYLYEIPATEVPPLLQPRYNGAPTQDFALCRMGAEPERAVGLLRWGLVPFWAKDISIGSRMILQEVFQIPALSHTGRRLVRMAEPAGREATLFSNSGR